LHQLFQPLCFRAFWSSEEAQKVHEAVLKSIEYNVVTIDLNPNFGTNEVGEFVSNYILNKDDLLYFIMTMYTLVSRQLFKKED
jgi:hypothetical protein